jgi:hypothetical protein
MRKPCKPCEARKAKLRETRGIVGQVARRVWPEVDKSGAVRRTVLTAGGSK